MKKYSPHLFILLFVYFLFIFVAFELFMTDSVAQSNIRLHEIKKYLCDRQLKENKLAIDCDPESRSSLPPNWNVCPIERIRNLTMNELLRSQNIRFLSSHCHLAIQREIKRREYILYGQKTEAFD